MCLTVTHNGTDWTYNNSAATPVTVTGFDTVIKVYRCPSAAMVDHRVNGAERCASMAYAANGGNNRNNVSNVNAGMFTRLGWIVRIRDVTDGMSNTIAIGEAGSFNNRTSYANRGDLPRWSGSHMDVAQDNITIRLVRDVTPPNLPNGNNYNGGAMTSQHPGGVQVLAGDGAVHFANENINPTVWHALGSKARGEANAQFQ
jgi:hypothetical protein